MDISFTFQKTAMENSFLYFILRFKLASGYTVEYFFRSFAEISLIYFNLGV